MGVQKPFTRFATVADVMSDSFVSITRVLNRIAVEHSLPDHSDVNHERYPWSVSFLSMPSFYAARMWEYPFAILSAELQQGMVCADIGCGMTPFTVYLKDNAKCEVVAVDPEVFDAGIRYKGHGVSQEFARKTGLEVVQCAMEATPLASDTFDRVFCVSVIEHLPSEVARRGVQEMARILKPGGRLIITVDVNMHSTISRPLDLVWESGLVPLGKMDLRWPAHRFGIFCNGKEPADVFGMTLAKEDYWVRTQYAGVGGGQDPPLVLHSSVPTLRSQDEGVAPPLRETPERPPLWRRIARRLRLALLALLRS